MSEPVEVLAALDGLGMYFAVAREPRGVPVAELYGPGSATLAGAVGRVRDRLGAEERTAASVWHLGYAARLVSPVVGAWALAGRRLRTPRAGMWLREDGGLAVVGGGLEAVGPAELLDPLLTEHLEPLAERLRAVHRLSPPLLAGNTASALVGALRVLPPALRTAAAPAVGAVLGRPPLAGALRPGSLIRRSCCLYYRVPGGGTCGDCPIGRR